MRGRNDGNWKTSGLIRKDFRQSHDDPEVTPAKSLKKKSGCRGGKPHEWENRPAPLRWSDREKKMVAYETWRAGRFCKRCDKRYDYIEQRRDFKRAQTKGCPRNDGKSHVYVWVKYVIDRGRFDPYTYYRKVCAGCNKNSGKSNYGSPPENIYETRTQHDIY